MENKIDWTKDLSKYYKKVIVCNICKQQFGTDHKNKSSYNYALCPKHTIVKKRFKDDAQN